MDLYTEKTGSVLQRANSGVIRSTYLFKQAVMTRAVVQHPPIVPSSSFACLLVTSSSSCMLFSFALARTICKVQQTLEAVE